MQTGFALNHIQITEPTMRHLLLLSLLASSTAFADGYALPYGEWRGQTQYQVFIRTASDPAGYSVTNLTIDISPQGKVTDLSTENGCCLLGLAAPGMTPTIATLNVTLTGCAYPRFNRTYNRHLSVFPRSGTPNFRCKRSTFLQARPAPTTSQQRWGAEHAIEGAAC